MHKSLDHSNNQRQDVVTRRKQWRMTQGERQEMVHPLFDMTENKPTLVLFTPTALTPGTQRLTTSPCPGGDKAEE